MYDNELVNAVEASGKVINIKSYPGGSQRITLLIKSGEKIFYPHFFLPKDLVDNSIEENERVHIKGHLRTYTSKNADGTQTFNKNVTIDEIKEEETLTKQAFNHKGMFYPEMFTRVYVKGRVAKLTDDGEWYRIVMDLGSNGRPTLSLKKRPKLPKINVDDKICAVGIITTAKKEYGDTSATFDTVILQDIAKL